MPGIFLSYRRDDAAGWTGRLADDLRREFPSPAYHVFYDIASIGIGEDFVEAMRRSLADCAVVLVMIGKNWLNAKDDAGSRRLDDPEDWVSVSPGRSDLLGLYLFTSFLTYARNRNPRPHHPEGGSIRRGTNTSFSALQRCNRAALATVER